MDKSFNLKYLSYCFLCILNFWEHQLMIFRFANFLVFLESDFAKSHWNSQSLSKLCTTNENNLAFARTQKKHFQGFKIRPEVICFYNFTDIFYIISTHLLFNWINLAWDNIWCKRIETRKNKNLINEIRSVANNKIGFEWIFIKKHLHLSKTRLILNNSMKYNATWYNFAIARPSL